MARVFSKSKGTSSRSRRNRTTSVNIKRLKLTTKIMLGMGLILFSADCIASIFFYHYVQNIYLDEIYKKTDIALGYIDATMEYVRDELRPKMLHVLEDTFIREAMSTSVVNKGIMARFSKKFPGYIYRRVAVNPMNPANTADAFERGYIEKFARTPAAANTWKGLITKDGERYFINLKAVRMAASCALCHGDPSTAPKSLRERYDVGRGFNWQVGAVVGLESIAIPVDDTFYQFRRTAFFIFLLGLTGMVVVFLVLNSFHYVVVVRPLKQASTFFKSVANGERGLEVDFDIQGYDEIAELGGSFNTMISHLKKLQGDLRYSERQYRQIFEGSKDSIIVTDCDGVVIDVNNAGVELFGCNNKDDFMRNVTVRDFFVHRECCQSFLETMETQGFAKDFEARFKKKDAGVIDVLITATRQADAQLRSCRYECIVKDISARKSMEQQIRQAEKLASIGQLAAGVAHEINNPLGIIIGYTGLLLKATTDDRAAQDLNVIRNNAVLCKKIVEDLLNFSRRTDTKFTKADIAATLASVIAVVETEFAAKGVTIRTDFDSDAPLVPISVDKIKQVGMNLLMNGLQAMDGPGEIVVSTRYDREGQRVHIAFADTGRGIPRSIQHRIFEPFFTTKEPGQGTGLGTSVSYGIIQEHHGEISFASEERHGTTFMIWLPIEATAP